MRLKLTFKLHFLTESQSKWNGNTIISSSVVYTPSQKSTSHFAHGSNLFIFFRKTLDPIMFHGIVGLVFVCAHTEVRFKWHFTRVQNLLDFFLLCPCSCLIHKFYSAFFCLHVNLIILMFDVWFVILIRITSICVSHVWLDIFTISPDLIFSYLLHNLNLNCLYLV